MKELDFARIGQRIREVRLSKHLTQDYLSYATGVNVPHISNIENNRTKVSLTLLVAICNALGVTVDYILQSEYTKESPAIEAELLHTMRTLPLEKQRQLLRIAQAL